RAAVPGDGVEGPMGHPRGGMSPVHGLGLQLHDDGPAGRAGGIRHRGRGVRQVLLHRERDVMTASTIRRRMQGLTVEEHTLTVPLVWDDPADTRTIDVFAAVVSREGGEDLPYLLFLQGGPGHEAPRVFQSSASPSWLEAALAEHRLVLLDQRGTGRSTPVGDGDLERGSDAVAEHLTHLRADSIVRDAEALRQHLGAETWSVLGQSFGGFTTLAYLSTDAASLDRVYITGGLSTLDRSPDEVY